MPDIGQPAPDFTLPAQDMKNISLSDYRGEKAVVPLVPYLLVHRRLNGPSHLDA